ncbi:hypothetical protein [Janthinobacterium sp. 17J80-10]|uniref:hypothetical protein n=1 Tax=Janthinobacterium sp. 17J80-10 TaxID=2497863 RepID=UPI0010055210|nr:hypothetical protein [Janthinobacterium sp. 17J80-10]QAU34472.1 hypothetical protein EKL02_09930 [Janthinobacterium sp. 17J80-10]
MNEYRHHVSGFFANRGDADSAVSRLVERGLPPEQLHIFDTDAPAPAPAPKDDSNAVLKDAIVDGAKGAIIGTGIGALGQIALVAANVSLFVASPLIAPLAMLGWGASLGGLVGAAAGAARSPAPAAEKKEGWLSDLVRDAIASGQTVLVVQTRTQQETATAQGVIQAAVGDYTDTGPM